MDADKQAVSAAFVCQMGTFRGIQLRSGCVCNVGACHSELRLTGEQVKRHFQVRGVAH